MAIRPQAHDEAVMPSDRSDVFISYNHASSKPFAKQLVNRLKSENLEVWFDEEDIPAGVDFVDTFLKGVEGANTVVLILTHAYLDSKNCIREMEKAREFNKRIMLAIHEPDFSKFGELPADISRINAIFFCERPAKPFDFDKACNELLVAIKRDPEHTRQHTNYLVRAKEWQTNDRHESYLLLGDAIAEAENWRDTEVKISPFPTQDQLNYIRISREEQTKRDAAQQKLQAQATRRQRNFMVLLFVGMLGILIYLLSVGVQLNNRNQLLQEKRIDDTASAAQMILIDNFIALQSTSADDAILAEHQEDIDLLAFLYPTINIYTTTLDFEILADSDARILPTTEIGEVYQSAVIDSENYSRYFEIPSVLYEDFESIEVTDGITLDSFRVAYDELTDTQGAVVGYLVLEIANPIENIIDNLFGSLIIMGLIYIALMIIYIVIFFRSRLRLLMENRRIRREKHTQDLKIVNP